MKELSKISKKCKKCHRRFFPYIRANNWQMFCSIKCQVAYNKKEYHKNKKRLKKIRDKAPKKYPTYACQKCGHITKLNFFPQSDKQWITYKCIKCGE